MSQTFPVAEERRRPGAVSTASYLMYLVAALLLIGTILAFAVMNRILDATRSAYAGASNPEQYVSITRVSIIVSAVLYVVIAAAFVVLGAFNLRGSRPARIITWVLAGLGVLCLGCGTISSSLSSSLSNRMESGTVNGVDVKKATQQISDAYPSYYRPVSITTEVIALLAMIVIIILLALPVSNSFFQKRQALGVDPGFPSLPYPPMSGPGVPGGYPGTAGPGTMGSGTGTPGTGGERPPTEPPAGPVG